MTRSIGGPVTPAGLGALLGDRPGNGRLHAEAHDLALADATDHVRRAAAALRSVEIPNARRQAELGRLHAMLVDVEAALRAVERWPG